MAFNIFWTTLNILGWVMIVGVVIASVAFVNDIYCKWSGRSDETEVEDRDSSSYRDFFGF